MRTRLSILALAAIGAAMTGCDVGDTTLEVTHVQPISVPPMKPVADAGIGAVVDPTPDNQPAQIALRRAFPARADAFALLPGEVSFDRSQTAARLVSEGGGWVNFFAVPEEATEVAVVFEPLPLWRLSGVVIGDGVAALLDMGGKVVDIRPGMKIPDTDWVVVSIDAERAILRRDNGKLPRTFIVPLQGAMNPSAGNPGAGGGNRGGNGKLTPGDMGGEGGGPGRQTGVGD